MKRRIQDEGGRGKGKSLVAMDLFAGVGGWAVAARGLPIEMRYALDWDHKALITYGLNHPQTKLLCADIRQLPIRLGELVGKVDLIVGGIPCEPISVWRRGLNPTGDEELADWHTILDRCLAIIERLDPPWWCLEDVPEVVKHLPILTPHTIINSEGFSGQRRKRAYVGCFPRPSSAGDARQLADYLRPGPFRVGTRTLRRRIKQGKSFEPGCHRVMLPDRKSDTICDFGSRRDPECVVYVDGRKRQLEWQEAAALQGFPEDYLFYGSPTTVSQHIGQAIQIDTGRAILAAICDEARRINGFCVESGRQRSVRRCARGPRSDQ